MNVWDLIVGDVPRTWDWYDCLGRWIGRDLAPHADAALAAAVEHLSSDAAYIGRPVTVYVRCCDTDERARIKITIKVTIKDHQACLPLY